MDTAFFYFFALLVLGGAILTITRRSAIHSAICLIVSLVGVAGLYLLQKAEFLFAVQIILYRRHHGAVPVRDHREPRRTGKAAV
jgi:NADH-quinone oxidoreductase subunit J